MTWTKERHEAAKARCKETIAPRVSFSRERLSQYLAACEGAAADLPDALAEIESLQEMLFDIVASLEPYDARDSEWLHCVVCRVEDKEAHEEDCGYKLGLDYFKRTRPELWTEES